MLHINLIFLSISLSELFYVHGKIINMFNDLFLDCLK